MSSARIRSVLNVAKMSQSNYMLEGYNQGQTYNFHGGRARNCRYNIQDYFPRPMNQSLSRVYIKQCDISVDGPCVGLQLQMCPGMFFSSGKRPEKRGRDLYRWVDGICCFDGSQLPHNVDIICSLRVEFVSQR